MVTFPPLEMVAPNPLGLLPYIIPVGQQMSDGVGSLN